jgi:hypothetical protein
MVRRKLAREAIDAHIAQAQKLPSALSLMHLYPIDGAVRRVGKSDTAWNTRDATWSMVIAGIDPNPQKAGEIFRFMERRNAQASLIIISASHSRSASHTTQC